MQAQNEIRKLTHPRGLLLFAALITIFTFTAIDSQCQDLAARLMIPLGKSITIPANGVQKILAVKEGVVEVLNVSEDEIIISGVGEAPNTTQIILWDSTGKRVYDVETFSENDTLVQKYASVLGNPQVSMLMFPDGVYLKGSVADVSEKERAEKVARELVPERRIVSLISLAQPGITLEKLIEDAIKIPTVKVTVIAPGGGTAASSNTPDSSSGGSASLVASETKSFRLVLHGFVETQNDYIHLSEIVRGFVSSEESISNLVTIKNPIQVVFQAYVLQVNKNNSHDLGIEWGANREDGLVQGTLKYIENFSDVFRGDVRSVGAPIDSWANPLKMNNINRFDLIAATVKAWETKSRVKVLANPKLTVYANAAPNKIARAGWTDEKKEADSEATIETDSGLAFVSVGQDIYYPAQVDTNGNITYGQAKAALKLLIRDLFVNEGTLKFSVFAKQDEPSFSRGANAPPDILKRSIMTTVQIANEETVVLGGLINRNKEMTESQVPVLSKLPFLGRLFRSKNTQTRENELVILLTPQIVHQNVDLGGKKKYETIPVPQRSDRLEKLHQTFRRIKDSHFPPEAPK